MKNETNVISRRYYLFRHTGSGENIEWYVGQTWLFDHDKSLSLLLSNKDDFYYVVKENKQESIKNNTKDFIYVIGAVDVIVSGMFPLEIVE